MKRIRTLPVKNREMAGDINEKNYEKLITIHQEIGSRRSRLIEIVKEKNKLLKEGVHTFATREYYLLRADYQSIRAQIMILNNIKQDLNQKE
ncbi:MAG TPA: hypothetical protein VF868_10890 [Bacteroidia bacterium]